MWVKILAALFGLGGGGGNDGVKTMLFTFLVLFGLFAAGVAFLAVQVSRENGIDVPVDSPLSTLFNWISSITGAAGGGAQ